MSSFIQKNKADILGQWTVVLVTVLVMSLVLAAAKMNQDAQLALKYATLAGLCVILSPRPAVTLGAALGFIALRFLFLLAIKPDWRILAVVLVSGFLFFALARWQSDDQGSQTIKIPGHFGLMCLDVALGLALFFAIHSLIGRT